MVISSPALMVCLAYTSNPSISPLGGLAWFRKPLKEQEEILGDDPWPYGLETNRRTVETLMSYLLEQGLINEKLPIEELFASNTHHL